MIEQENKVLAIEKYELPILLCTILKTSSNTCSLALRKNVGSREPINQIANNNTTQRLR
jgi:hypothetical protein